MKKSRSQMENTLSLQDFVESTLSDICEAVNNARLKHSYIAPKNSASDFNPKEATIVEFDIAVTVIDSDSISDSKSGQISGGLKIGVIKAEASLAARDKKYKENHSSKESRVRFSVPVFFRFSEEEKKEQDRRYKEAQSSFSRSNY